MPGPRDFTEGMMHEEGVRRPRASFDGDDQRRLSATGGSFDAQPSR